MWHTIYVRGPHFHKKGLAGRIKRKNVSPGRNRWLKMLLYYKNSSSSNKLSNIYDVEGRVFETPVLAYTFMF